MKDFTEENKREPFKIETENENKDKTIRFFGG